MESEKDNVSRVEDKQEVKVEDLSVDDAEQNIVKGGVTSGGRIPGKINLNT